MTATTKIAALFARRDFAARAGTWAARDMRECFRAASRAVRIRRSGYAARTWLPGYGQNTPLAEVARLAGGGWV